MGAPLTQPALSRRRLAREVFDLAWPAILQGLLTTLIFFTDRLLLGRYGADVLGSMQISGPVLWSVFSVFGAFAAGTVAVVGRAVGADDEQRTAQTLRAVLLFAAAVGTLVAVGGWLGSAWIASVVGGAEPSARPLQALAETYMSMVFLVAPLNLVAALGVTAMQAGGDTRSPVWISLLTGLLNLFLTWLLVYGQLGAPELGILGAAIGTTAAFSLHCVLVLGVLWRSRRLVSLARPARPSLDALAPVLRISLPAFGEKLFFHLGFIAFASYIGRLGDVAMAANQTLIAIEALGFIVASGFGIASGALVSQKLGAKQPEAASICAWLSAGLGVLVLGCVSLVFLLFATPLVSLISTDPVVIELGARCLRIAAIAQPLMALTEAFAGALRGAGDTRSPMIIALIGPVIVRLLACWYLAFELDWGLWGIWVGTTLDWALRASLLSWVFYRGRWRTIHV